MIARLVAFTVAPTPEGVLHHEAADDADDVQPRRRPSERRAHEQGRRRHQPEDEADRL
jgi:hypothetical protein